MSINHAKKQAKSAKQLVRAQKLVRVNFNTKEKICLSNLDKHERLDLGESPKDAPKIDGFMSEGLQAFRGKNKKKVNRSVVFCLYRNIYLNPSDRKTSLGLMQ